MGIVPPIMENQVEKNLGNNTGKCVFLDDDEVDYQYFGFSYLLRPLHYPKGRFRARGFGAWAWSRV